MGPDFKGIEHLVKIYGSHVETDITRSTLSNISFSLKNASSSLIEKYQSDP